MLRLSLLCAVLLLSGTALSIQVFSSADQPDEQTSRSADDVTQLPTTSSDKTVVSSQAPPVAETTNRTAVTATWQPDDPIGVVLTGTVRWRDGTPVDEPGVYLRQGRTRPSASTASDGSYAVVGLQPGEWSVSVRVEGAVDVTETITLGDDAQQEHDFVLDRSYPVRVTIVTADGEDGTRALRMALHGFGDFTIAGQRDRFPDQLAPTDYGMVFVGDAKWDSERNPKDGAAGKLFLASAPPQHVALLQRHLVLEQQLVQPGQTEVKFTIDVAELKKLAGSATLRVLDAQSGQPLTNARVSLNTSNRGGGGKVVDDEGRAVVEGLSPGLLRCQIAAPDHESYYCTVRVGAGERLELGDIRLGPQMPLKGTVLDADGNPATARLSWTELKWHTTGTKFATNRSAHVEADGSFSLWGTGRGRIAVKARSADGSLAAGVFDNPPTTDVVLRLSKASQCVVTRPKDPTRAFTVTLFDEAKLAISAVVLGPRNTKLTISMPPGSYDFEVRDQQARLLQTGSLTFAAAPCSLEIR